MSAGNFDFAVLRELRKQAGLSIGELAARSGVSAAVISKLERNRSRAELETLLRIGRVYGLTAAELLNLAEAGVTRRLEIIRRRSEDFDFEEFRYRNIRCLYGRAAAGGRLFSPKSHRDDYEICRVLRGRLRVLLPTGEYLVPAGEAIEFDALLEHRYEALEDCEVIIIHRRKK